MCTYAVRFAIQTRHYTIVVSFRLYNILEADEYGILAWGNLLDVITFHPHIALRSYEPI